MYTSSRASRRIFAIYSTLISSLARIRSSKVVLKIELMYIKGLLVCLAVYKVYREVAGVSQRQGYLHIWHASPRLPHRRTSHLACSSSSTFPHINVGILRALQDVPDSIHGWQEELLDLLNERRDEQREIAFFCDYEEISLRELPWMGRVRAHFIDLVYCVSEWQC
jgi:hypothetical protein